MNDNDALIRAALDRRFARLPVPACPENAWQVRATAPPHVARPRTRIRGYAAAVIAALAIAGGLSAKLTLASLAPPHAEGFVSSRPLEPWVHAADRLTIAQAERRLPFSIVVPAGLPERTHFMYASLIDASRVSLAYEVPLGSRYYRLDLQESAAAGPESARFEATGPDGSKTWSVRLIRWNHGRVFMSMLAGVLPAEIGDRIVRANSVP